MDEGICENNQQVHDPEDNDPKTKVEPSNRFPLFDRNRVEYLSRHYPDRSSSHRQDRY